MYKDQEQAIAWFFNDRNSPSKPGQTACLELRYTRAKKELEVREAEFKNQAQIQQHKMNELVSENEILKQQLKVKKVDDLLGQVSGNEGKPEDDSGSCLIM